MRIYNYIIINRLGKPTLEKNRCWHIMKKLDLDIMKKGAKKFIGTKDFSTFRASSCRAKSPIKTMKQVKIKSFKDKIEIEFRSQSFLQQQVRSMVGCLKYLGEKKWTLKKFENVTKSKKRTLCAPPAPPQGLFLARIIFASCCLSMMISIIFFIREIQISTKALKLHLSDMDVKFKE